MKDWATSKSTALALPSGTMTRQHMPMRTRHAAKGKISTAQMRSAFLAILGLVDDTTDIKARGLVIMARTAPRSTAATDQKPPEPRLK